MEIVKAFVEMTEYLFSLPESERPLFVLSEHISQDPLENYFGQQRATGGRCDNPSVAECVVNANSLRLQKSLALAPLRGNSSRRRRLFPEEVVDSTPLPERQSTHKSSFP